MFIRFRLALILGLIVFSQSSLASAEDVPHVRDDAKRIVRILASRAYWGRGYTKHGMRKASRFVEREMTEAGLTPLAGKDFRQPFQYPVNTFPGKMEVRVNGHPLTPGVDYIVSPSTKGGKLAGDLTPKGPDTYLDPTGKVTILVKDKLTWSVSGKQVEGAVITLDRAKFRETPNRFAFDIESTLVPSFHAQNLAGVVRGTVNPDRYMVFTAHYDHLGGMGTEAFFPGANDNASGVSLLLSLAKYYVAHPQPYSIAFIFFAGEEAGLIGSKYFAEHPLIDLKKIRFVMNFDLEGTGESGATVVNASEFPTEFAVLTKINSEGHYLSQIGSRGKAANSDHYWFSEHGVPAFFMYTMGGIKAYHDVFDRAETLPLNKVDDVFALTLKFGQKLSETE